MVYRHLVNRNDYRCSNIISDTQESKIMNETNTKKLFDDFPEFWKHRDNMQASLMCFGFECNDGWFDIIYKLCDDIKSYYKNKIPEHFYVVQVKEKFGGLRFYITAAPKEIHDMIANVEATSYKICEKCGKPGKLRDKLPWWLTLCDKHFKEKVKEDGVKIQNAIKRRHLQKAEMGS